MDVNSRIRIVNKSKDGVSLRAAQGQTVKISWKEFELLYDPAGKYHCRLKPEAAERFQKAFDKIDMIVIHYMKSRPAVADRKDPKDLLVSMGVIGKLTQEVQELLGCTGADVIKLVQNRINPIRPYMTETPECAKRIRKEKNIAENNARREAKAKERSVYTATQSLSDAKGFDKLKDLKFN